MKSFADLLKNVGDDLPEGEPAPPAPPAPELKPTKVWNHKVVIRTTKKGYGGKIVSVVQGCLEPELVCKPLKKMLSVGVRIDGNNLIVQGNQLTRLEKWLTEQGVRTVIRG